MAIVNECPRHRGFLPTRDEAIRRGGGYYVERCTHIGERFVVQVSAHDQRWMTIDYVEDVGPDTVIVEPHSTYDPNLAATIYDDLVDRLRRDDPPVPDDATFHYA